MNLANEGLEAKKKEEEIQAKKRKAEDDKLWEGTSQKFVSSKDVWVDGVFLFTETREQRVGSWRTFANNGKKKKKAKIQVLG